MMNGTTEKIQHQKLLVVRAAQLWRQLSRLSCKAVARYESRTSSTPPWTKAVVVSAEVSSFPQRRHSSLSRVVTVKLLDKLKKRVTGRGFKDVRERLQFHISISEKIIALGLFSVLAGEKLELEKYFGRIEISSVTRLVDTTFLGSLKLFVAEKGLFALLALFTTIWYFLYARAVRNEMGIIVDTFSRFKPPQNWEDIVGKNIIPVLSVGITVTFLALAWFIDNIKMYCL